LKIAFKIPPNVYDISDSHLLIELGNNQITILIFSINPFVLKGFYVYEFSKNIHPNDYSEELKIVRDDEEIFNQKFVSIKVCYNLSSATLVPTSFFIEAEKENVLELMLGKEVSANAFSEDVIGNNDIKILYRIPSIIYETVNELFPQKTFLHSSSIQLQEPTQKVDMLNCIIYQNQMKVILFKQGKLQISQYFDFDTPIDVSYHLLNVCERFAVSPSVVKLILSGMIVEKSNLYDDIHKYFLDIHFASLPQSLTISEDMNIHPPHFYHNLIALAQCE
jgi:hypothetical protein